MASQDMQTGSNHASDSSFVKGGAESARRRIFKSLPASEGGTPFRKGRIPDAPGVYFFMNRQRKVLYVGKATSLRSRVRSYFASNIAEKRSTWIAKMLTEAKSIDFRKTDSVLEAILLEADLIKKLQPKYNTDLKDDKSFNCIGITDEDFPRVLLIRSHDIASKTLLTLNFKLLTYFGPFPHGTKLSEALKIIRKIFPFRDNRCTPCILPHSSVSGRRRSAGCKPCFNRQIGLCPGTCTGEISKVEYKKVIRNLTLFLSGKKAQLLTHIEKEMKSLAKAEHFERAGELKRQLFALRHIQDVALIQTNNQRPTTGNQERIEAYDLSHFGGKNIVGAMTVVENGLPKTGDYRMFKLCAINGPHEVKGIEEILKRRFKHAEWPFPSLVVVDGNDVQKKTAERVLKTLKLSIPVVAVVKDNKHKPERFLGIMNSTQIKKQDILLANSEAHRFVLRFQRKQRKLSHIDTV
ncbi:MAG: hypothetical protein COV91_05435 [Candidatus Taylorbacteria bacterium CG11_big_fil_rev_8_21_14_0_20_46_11]|uniref:Excinuclease ABC subunit C n=1 Tax=Candidatus Taylorbacteria bacterium CG11_big_fil_rev_8_21_14_0_20_46_11 TaxID=1975025 RepID=A0A2H0KCR6_9BACT|nr:MAG: hypothetical protein COV91_05435 [Candidatus Taylorbacteria bacterium CG11_big_fil_rev_8_21_14_0_20_46_11]